MQRVFSSLGNQADIKYTVLAEKSIVCCLRDGLNLPYISFIEDIFAFEITKKEGS